MIGPKPLITKPPKEDTRERRGNWAPGNYYNHCANCNEIFIGAKLALSCADCAYKNDSSVSVHEKLAAINEERARLNQRLRELGKLERDALGIDESGERVQDTLDDIE